MAIYLYKSPDCKGKSLTVSRNYSTLKNTPVKNSTSSFKLTVKTNRVLLFKKKNYRGGCMFRWGKQTIEKMSSPGKGGKIGFGNTVSSVRITPFDINLNVVVVCDDCGNLPGGLPSRSTTRAYVTKMVAEANRLWKPGLLQFKLHSYGYRESSKKHDLRSSTLFSFPSSWKKSKQCNVFLVNTMKGADGTSKPPCWGRAVVVQATGNSDKYSGNHLAHEIGHFLGIHHASANKNRNNLMHSSAPPGEAEKLYQNQVQQVHITLSKNVSRRGLRTND